ncbi:MAG: hypothetical protein Q9165_001077 [Trypethelium subeluteriae]
MKLITYAFALTCMTSLSFAGVINQPEGTLNERDVTSNEHTLVSNLYEQILQKDAKINSTVAGINSESTAAENQTAIATVRSDIESITSLTNTAAASALLQKRILDPRQASNSTIDLADLLVTLLEEVINTVNQLVDNLGLGE